MNLGPGLMALPKTTSCELDTSDQESELGVWMWEEKKVLLLNRSELLGEMTNRESRLRGS